MQFTTTKQRQRMEFPAQISGAQGSGRRPVARLCGICFCLSR